MKKETNKKFWDRFAFLYTPFMKSNDPVYDAACRTVRPYLNRNMDVLELACGTGQFTGRLSGCTGSWTATDFSEKMIREAGRKHRGKNLRFETADAVDLGYFDRSFDLVVIANALHIMPEPEKALQEIRRVLKPGGLLFAPVFIAAQKSGKHRLDLLEHIGFKTYHTWDAGSYSSFIREQGFDILKTDLIPGKPLFECSMLAKVPLEENRNNR